MDFKSTMENITINSTQKKEQYKELLPQIESLISTENNFVANIANITAALKSTFSYYSWVGFYLMENNELVLGPFQGNIACTRIAFGKGVCGTSAKEKKTIIVPDVHKFPGHIFCDGNSKSEIVIPILYNNKVYGVLDVDSYEFNSFDEIDMVYLEQLVSLIIQKHKDTIFR